MGYGKGGRETREGGDRRPEKREDKKEEAKATFIDIADEVVLERVVKNFDSFVTSKKLAAEIEPDEEDEEAEEPSKAHDFDAFKTLMEKNGRKG